MQTQRTIEQMLTYTYSVSWHNRFPLTFLTVNYNYNQHREKSFIMVAVVAAIIRYDSCLPVTCYLGLFKIRNYANYLNRQKMQSAGHWNRKSYGSSSLTSTMFIHSLEEIPLAVIAFSFTCYIHHWRAI